MATKRNERSAGRGGKATGADPYTKLAQENRASHESVVRSLDRASKIAKRAAQPRTNRPS